MNKKEEERISLFKEYVDYFERLNKAPEDVQGVVLKKIKESAIVRDMGGKIIIDLSSIPRIDLKKGLHN